jgi:hypothetical protein
VSDSDSVPSHPAPPARGWYRIPDNPNYEQFWDGQKWASQRYWGGASSGTTGTSHSFGPPPVAGTRLPEIPTPEETERTWNVGPSAQRPFSSPDQGGRASQVRFYAITTIIVPPVFVLFFTLIAVSAIPNHSGRAVGIVAAVLAVLFVVLFSRRPYVAIVRPDGSLTFKALVGSKETAISRISRIGLRTGTRGAASWIFYFDGTTAPLGDIGGRALARYVTARDPTVEHPVSRLFG